MKAKKSFVLTEDEKTNTVTLKLNKDILVNILGYGCFEELKEDYGTLKNAVKCMIADNAQE